MSISEVSYIYIHTYTLVSIKVHIFIFKFQAIPKMDERWANVEILHDNAMR